MAPPVALVTGANRGIGSQVAKDLYKKGFSVVLACRDRNKGSAVADEIAKSFDGSAAGQTLSVIQLDLADPSTIASAVADFRKQHEGLDVLVNNAAILVDDRKAVLEVNYYNTIAVTEAFLPLLAASGAGKATKSRIVIVSSRMGCFDGAKITGDALAALKEPKDLDRINALAKAWEGGDDSTSLSIGEPNAPYSSSKALISAYGRILAQRLAAQKVPVGVYVTCPGYVSTAMNGHSGTKTLEEGADTLVWAATDASLENESGKFYAERHEIPFDTFDRSQLPTAASKVPTSN